MRLLVTGDRKWTDRLLIRSVLLMYLNEAKRRGEGLVVIHGGAAGADTIAGEEAGKLKIPCEVYHANWSVTDATPKSAIRKRSNGAAYDVRGGHLRNQRMLDAGMPTHAVAFHEDLRRGGGTADMVKRIEKAGLSLRVLPSDTRRTQTAMEV